MPMICFSIPISVVGAFIFMNAFGRNLNVVSLAGISFAVGMLVDNAIVVLENIDRHKKSLGKSPFQAARDGVKEVWGADNRGKGSYPVHWSGRKCTRQISQDMGAEYEEMYYSGQLTLAMGA